MRSRILHGVQAVGLPDPRPWLDLGFWDVRHPLAADGGGAPPLRTAYSFLPVEGDDLHQIPVGPVHAGIIEPGHFRFTANGETVVRLEQRLGYVHKGIDALMTGAPLHKAARLAGRTSGDSTVAYALAFALAVEAASGISVPGRARYLRVLMAEIERLANHFGDFGAICNDASFSIMHAECGVLRERILRCADSCFGHRLMMDCVVPGGVAGDLDADRVGTVSALLKEIRRVFPKLIELYENTASLQDRTAATGILSADLAKQFGAGGYVGRGSGRAFDTRKALPYAPYDALDFEVPVFDAGDVDARVWVRIREIEQSLAADRPDPAAAARRGDPGRRRSGSRHSRRPWHRGIVSRRRACLGATGRRSGCTLSLARSVVVPMAAAGSRDRRQHRGRLPAVQQIVQLLVFGPRSLGPRMRNIPARLFRRPLTEAAPDPDEQMLGELAASVDRAAYRRLGRSLSIRQVDAGSCNGCELEIHALNNAFYDLERFGLRFVASPRHADVLLVTGPVTRNMRQACSGPMTQRPLPNGSSQSATAR